MELRLQLRNRNSGVKLSDLVEGFFSEDTITEWFRDTILFTICNHYYAVKKNLSANT